MKKEDFFAPMDAELKDGVWKVGNLDPRFDCKSLEHLGYKDAGIGRLDHHYYLFYYASLLPEKSRIVEIGTGTGLSAISMGMGIRGRESIIITIDPGMMCRDELIGRFEELRKHELILGSLHKVMQNIRDARLEGYIVPIPDTSENVLKRWDGRRIDMLFVDGSHTYEDVKKDCEWMQYVRKGGVAVFDDWIEPVEKAVREYVANYPEWELLTESTRQAPGHPWKTVLFRN